MVLEAPAQRDQLSERDADQELVAAVRAGDERAFEALYARYHRRISAYVLGMVKDHGRAEDVTQEVFISALRRMRETERPIVFRPWIYEIAKNACIDQFRRTRRAEEISFEGGDGLGAADQGRLVATDPTPDAAVDAKQQLDHLCGAFGGLSDSHHEILVLRELEGLSYREIGDRMGLSRPGVESTLFRARRRLTEEYDELVSGQRCLRIQSIILEAGETAPGTRDSRRLARHVAHCQPCRREAALAGLDAALLAHRPARRRIAEKVASLLPLPAFLRARVVGNSAPMAGPLSEPMAAALSKAVAVAATLAIAGAGAGVGTGSASSDLPRGASAARPTTIAPVAVGAPAAAPAASRSVLAARHADRPTRASVGSSRTVHRGGSSRSLPPAGHQPRSSAARPGARAPAPGGQSEPGGGAASGAPSSSAPAGGGGASSSRPVVPDVPAAPKLPVPVPDPTGVTPTQVGDTVKAVQETGAEVIDTAGQAVSQATDALPVKLGG